MAGYGWNSYDPRTGGVQTIHDKENGIDIETSFVKFDEGRGGWGARIKGTVRDDAEPVQGSAGELKTAVWFTISAEGLGSVEPEDVEEAGSFGYSGDVVFNGQSPSLGDYKITVAAAKDSQHPAHGHPSYQHKPLENTFVDSLTVPEEALWQSKRKWLHSFSFSQLKTKYMRQLSCSSQ
jgi:mannosyl-oligosaccharide glucosidase